MITISIDFTEEDGQKVVKEEIRKRLASKIPVHYGQEIENKIQAAVRAGIDKEILELDLSIQIRKIIDDKLNSILADSIRRQIKDIVRLAVHKELEAQKAEFKIGLEGV